MPSSRKQTNPRPIYPATRANGFAMEVDGSAPRSKRHRSSPIDGPEARSEARPEDGSEDAPEEDVTFVGQVSWEERDERLRADAVCLEDLTDVSDADADEQVACVGEVTWAERDSRLRSSSIDIDTTPERPMATEGKGDVVKAEVVEQKPAIMDTSTMAALPTSQTLNPQQQRAVSLAIAGENIFLTGGAGTGKSYTLNHVIQALKETHGPNSVFVTATTGIAATVIGGTTLHSFAGIGQGAGSVNEWCARLNKYTRARWAAARVLIIDEVSMLDGGLFDKLDELGRRLLETDRVFGGIQLILCGDFFQLPPVGLVRDRLKFLFEARSWSAAAKHTVLLTAVFRQTDGSFVELLNEMRVRQTVCMRARRGCCTVCAM